MKGRRTAAMLCVLLGHALVVHMLMNLTRTGERERVEDDDSFVSELVYVMRDIDDRGLLELEEQFRRDDPPPVTRLEAPSMDAESLAGLPPGEAAETPGYVDWPREGKEAAARVLAREAEAERIARMFAGPQGTWASLTKRQASELSKFRWRPGVDGLERDAKGNTIYQFKNGCTLVNFLFIGCPLGAKPPAYGDLFKDMRLYFDEQRLPRTNEGNGTEPESLRPPKWQKPLE